jgi:tRNA threonylcarbamoyladenosine biosynthesis protein TsaB
MENGAEMERARADGRLVLALDTSTASLAAAVLRGVQTLGALQSMAERNHSVQTVPQIKALLAECGVKPEELDAIAVGRGPGSYTGMRIAVTVGKTLAWAWDKPLVGVSSLEALAYGAWQASSDGVSSAASSTVSAAVSGEAGDTPRGPSETDWIVPIMDARRGQVYTALFAASPEGGWKRLADDGIRLMRDWVDRINELRRSAAPDPQPGRPADAGQDSLPGAQLAPARIWIAGDLTLHETEAGRLRSLCEAEGGLAGACSVHLFPYAMDGRAVAALGAVRFARGELDDVHSFVPNYTQLAEAEVKLLAKQQCGEVNGR